MSIDDQIEIARKRVEEMEKCDKQGISLIDIMRPYSDLYRLLAFKMEVEILNITGLDDLKKSNT